MQYRGTARGVATCIARSVMWHRAQSESEWLARPCQRATHTHTHTQHWLVLTRTRICRQKQAGNMQRTHTQSTAAQAPEKPLIDSSSSSSRPSAVCLTCAARTGPGGGMSAIPLLSCCCCCCCSASHNGETVCVCVRVCHARARIYQSMLSPRHRALTYTHRPRPSSRERAKEAAV